MQDIALQHRKLYTEPVISGHYSYHPPTIGTLYSNFKGNGYYTTYSHLHVAIHAHVDRIYLCSMCI